MNPNMGKIDRLVRLLVALVLFGINLWGNFNGIWLDALLVLAFVLSITAIFRFSPLYKLLGISTCKIKE